MDMGPVGVVGEAVMDVFAKPECRGPEVGDRAAKDVHGLAPDGDVLGDELGFDDEVEVGFLDRRVVE